MTRLLRAIGFFGFLIASPAMAYEHKDEVTTYATAIAVSQIASDYCPDVVVRTTSAEEMQEMLHIVPADEMSMQLQIRTMTETFRENAIAYRKVWCEQQVERFGPNGTLMRGLLRREQ